MVAGLVPPFGWYDSTRYVGMGRRYGGDRRAASRKPLVFARVAYELPRARRLASSVRERRSSLRYTLER